MSSTNLSIEIELLAAPDDDLVQEVTDLVNRVYTVAEDGLWVQGATRTTMDEMAELIAAGQIAVARRDGLIAGAVRIQQLDDRRASSACWSRTPFIVAKASAVSWSRSPRTRADSGASPSCSSSCWSPANGRIRPNVPARLVNTRIGYRPVQSSTIDERYPQLAPLLAAPCDFVVYQKELVSSDDPDARNRPIAKT